MHPQEYTGLAAASQQPKPADDDTLLTSRQVRDLIGGVSEMCIWRWEHNPHSRFPQPLRINKRKYWRLGDLRRWRADLAARAGRQQTAA